MYTAMIKSAVIWGCWLEGRTDPAAKGLADGVEEQEVPNRVANSKYAFAPGHSVNSKDKLAGQDTKEQ
jgi:hypothetical protein